MNKATLGLLLRDDGRILMAEKTRGDGAGNRNFPGGKPEEEDGGDMRRCIARECRKEVGLNPDLNSLELVGKLRFYFSGVFKWEVEVFISRRFQKVRRSEDEDMKNPVWVLLAEIPYDQMWAADKDWLPKVLAGEKVDADIYYNADHSTVEKIVWREVSF